MFILPQVLACHFAVTVLVGSGLAQETFLFRGGPLVSTVAQPETEITLWAAFDPSHYAFASASFSIEAAEGEFTNAWSLLADGYEPPRAAGRFVHSTVDGQFHFPPVVYADPSNPIAFIRATWILDSFAPRDISLHTITHAFRTYPWRESSAHMDMMSTFTEGSAIIRVRRCYADCDGTDDLDFLDFLCFQDAFATDDYYADCDGSGELDFFDFLCFQNEFVLGCE